VSGLRAGARSQAKGGSAVIRLSPRELEVLSHLCRGKVSNRDLAEALMISEYTVHYHMGSLMAKLEVSTRAALIARAYTSGLIMVEEVA
jgi:DNA-binding CsgD family transcriptional regulator